MSERDAMGGGDARDRGETPHGGEGGGERRESLGKGRSGKAGSGAERTTKKRRKVNHGTEVPTPCCVFCPWLRYWW